MKIWQQYMMIIAKVVIIGSGSLLFYRILFSFVKKKTFFYRYCKVPMS